MFQESRFDKATIFWREIEIKALKKTQFGTGFLVLDLGCGEGEVAREVFGGRRLEWGLDNDEEMVKKARRSGVYKKVLLANAGKIPLKDKVVDMVFSNSVLEHIKDLDKVLVEVFRVLKPGGRLVFTVPTDKLGEFLGWGRWYALLFNKKYNHYHLYDLRKWKEILGKHGLKVIKGEYYLGRDEVKYWHKLLWAAKLAWPYSTSEQTYASLRPVPMRNTGAGLAIVARAT